VPFDFEAMLASDRYQLLLATVLPRPIVRVTSRNRCGAITSAPFSLFSVFGSDPATVGIGIGSKGPAEPKGPLSERNAVRSERLPPLGSK
jgi:flavin reductase (DIM6/NTAB) family NADH-FMN oxidoreductase RutF